MRASLHGIHKDVKIHIVGQRGPRSNGVISREPEPNATHVYYRDNYGGNERMAPVEAVRVKRRPRLTAQKV